MSKLTRREFLEDSILAAAVAAAFPAADAFAAEKKGKQQPTASKKSGDLLQVAIVGAGSRGGNHISEFLANPNTEIAYIVDADEAHAQQGAQRVAERQGKMPKVLTDFRKALDDKSVHIVSQATPNHWHGLVAILAMQAGKDVYSEKPAAGRIDESRRMIQVARKLNRICQIGTQCRSMKGTIDAVEYVKAGKIGEVKLARGLCYKRRTTIGAKGTYTPPATVDYDLWCGPAQKLPLTRQKFHYDWHWQREWGNGDMGNQGPHQMDIAHWGLGAGRLADRVIAFGGRLGYEDAGDVANTAVSLSEFGDKTLVFEVRGLATDPLRGASVGVIFYGSQGYVVLTTYTNGAAFDPQGNRVKTFSGGGDHFGNFVDAVKARDMKLLTADVEQIHLTHAHSHLSNISYYLGKPASADDIKHALADWKTNDDVKDTLDRTIKHLTANKVDLAKTPLMLGPSLTIAHDKDHESIVGNEAAAAMMTRDYRAPFSVPKAGEI
jgi:predicted dehydrogenase